MNIYTQAFSAKCVKNDRSVNYVLTIESPSMVLVEDIQAAVDELAKGYHEEFANRLYERFGGRQVLVAHHHGTDIVTVRP